MTIPAEYRPANAVTLMPWLGGLTYRPGWEIGIEDDIDWFSAAWRPRPADIDAGGHVRLVVISSVQNSDNPLAPIKVVHRKRFHVDDVACREEMLALVFVFLREIELHECAEWLRLDGRPLFDPHDAALAAEFDIGDDDAHEWLPDVITVNVGHYL